MIGDNCFVSAVLQGMVELSYSSTIRHTVTHTVQLEETYVEDHAYNFPGIRHELVKWHQSTSSGSLTSLAVCHMAEGSKMFCTGFCTIQKLYTDASSAQYEPRQSSMISKIGWVFHLVRHPRKIHITAIRSDASAPCQLACQLGQDLMATKSPPALSQQR